MKYEIDSEAVSETVMYVEAEVNELNFIMQGLVLHESEIDCETLLKIVMDAETEVNELNFKMQESALHENKLKVELSPSKKIVLFASMKAL